MATKGSRRILLRLLALSICVGLGTWSAFLFSPMISSEQSQIDDSGRCGNTLCGPKSESSHASGATARGREREDLGTRPKNYDNDDSSECSGLKETDADTATLTVSFLEAGGEPITGVDVRSIVFIPRNNGRRAHVQTATRTTSEAGELAFAYPLTYEVSLEVISKDWYLRPGTVVPIAAKYCQLTLAPTATVTLTARFDDGTPVSCRVTLFRQQTEDSWSGRLRDGRVEIQGVAIDADVQCLISSQYRFPYKDYICTFRRSELALGQELQVVVPLPEKKNGKIRLEVVDGFLTPDHKILMELDGGIAGSVVGTVQNETATWESKQLVSGGRARLTVVGDQSWRSNWFEVGQGDVTVVRATLKESARIVAKIVDARGQPLTNAVLRLKDSGYVRYDNQGAPSRYMLSIARSDEDGVVTLDGMPAGKITLEAESWQKEPNTHTVDLIAGETRDLGTIILDDALGEIFVELVGCEEGKQYSVMVTPPSGSEIFPMRRVEGNEITISGLPMRKYWVGVTFTSGGRLVWGEVDLSTQSSQTIYLDVSHAEE